MTDLDDLRDRLLGKRFYSTEAKESFIVVGVDEPGLALLQYDDGTPWDEMCSSFILDEDSAERLGLNEHGLDSEQFVPLGAGPRIQQACDVGDHDWFPSPDQVWPDGLPDSIREVEPGHLETSTISSSDASSVDSLPAPWAPTLQRAITKRRGSATTVVRFSPATSLYTGAKSHTVRSVRVSTMWLK